MIANFSAEATPEVGSSMSTSFGLSASAIAMSMSLRLPSGSTRPLMRDVVGPDELQQPHHLRPLPAGVESAMVAKRAAREAAAISRLSITVWSRKS